MCCSPKAGELAIAPSVRPALAPATAAAPPANHINIRAPTLTSDPIPDPYTESDPAPYTVSDSESLSTSASLAKDHKK